MARPAHKPKTATLSSASTDGDLWKGVREGNSQAWEVLVRRYEPLVYTIATRAGLSMAEAGDCFQQTWLQLYLNRSKIKEPERISAWLTTTAKRESLRMRKRASRNVDFDESFALADPRPLPDEEVAAMERRARLDSALSRLDERCRALLTALFLAPESKSYDQIAADMSIPKNSMGPVRSRCLQKLQTILQNEGWI